MGIMTFKKILTVVFLLFVAGSLVGIIYITRNKTNEELVLEGVGCKRIRREESIGKDDLKCYLKTKAGKELVVIRDCREGIRGEDFLDVCAYSQFEMGKTTEKGQYVLETSDLITDMLHSQEYLKKEKKLEEKGTFYLTRMKEGCELNNDKDYNSLCFDLEVTQSQIEEIKKQNLEYLQKEKEFRGE
jgi:hypothetical protein